MILPKGSIIAFATIDAPTVWTELSEHNRAPLSVTVERIEHKQRMANGRLRSWHVADKRTWSTSWSELPHATLKTVDQKAGAEEIETFYYENAGDEFILSVRLPDGTKEAVPVMFSDFSKEVSKRGIYEFWEVSLSVEEV